MWILRKKNVREKKKQNIASIITTLRKKRTCFWRVLAWKRRFGSFQGRTNDFSWEELHIIYWNIHILDNLASPSPKDYTVLLPCAFFCKKSLFITMLNKIARENREKRHLWEIPRDYNSNDMGVEKKEKRKLFAIMFTLMEWLSSDLLFLYCAFTCSGLQHFRIQKRNEIKFNHISQMIRSTFSFLYTFSLHLLWLFSRLCTNMDIYGERIEHF